MLIDWYPHTRQFYAKIVDEIIRPSLFKPCEGNRTVELEEFPWGCLHNVRPSTRQLPLATKNNTDLDVELHSVIAYDHVSHSHNIIAAMLKKH